MAQSPLQTLLMALATGAAQALAPVAAKGVETAFGALSDYLGRQHPEATLEHAQRAVDPRLPETAAPLLQAAQDPEVVARAEAVLRAVELA